MEQNVEKGLGWLQKLLGLQTKYGFFSILKGLFIILVTGYVIFFALNPRYLLDKFETIQLEKHDKDVAKRFRTDAETRVTLSKLLNILDADRTWFLDIHNGKKNLSTGLGYLYGDMLVEECADGVESVEHEWQNVYLPKYTFIAKVYEDGYFWGSVDSIKSLDKSLYFKLKSNDVNEIAMLFLFNGETPLGVLGISFCGDNKMNPPLTGKWIRKAGTKIGLSFAREE